MTFNKASYTRALVAGALQRRRAARRIQSAFRARRGRSALNSRIKRISLNQNETKHSYQRFGSGTSAIELFHNVTHYSQNLMATTQGFDDPMGNTQDTRNRIGNEIVARGLKIKMLIGSKVDRPNLNVHVYVCKYNTSHTLSDSIFWAGPLGLGADSNRLLDHPNTDRVTPLKKLVIQNQNVIVSENRVHTCYRELYIPFKNWKVKYDSDTGGGKFPMYKDVGIAIVAYDTPDTNELQGVAWTTYSTCLYFKDP